MFDNIQVKIEGGFDVDYPKLVRIRQKFATDKLHNIPQTIHEQFLKEEVRAKITPDMRVAVGVGSRGIANLRTITTAVVAELKALGAIPFIVPAMGSHGGATVEGQIDVLAQYGITEENVGCPIHATMETVQVGEMPDGFPLFFDKNACESNATVIISRVKPHTDFRGPIESGLQKMLVIGLGKHKGATTIHSQGFDRFAEIIPQAGAILIEKTNIAIGVAVLENAHDETAQIVALPAEKICAEEPALQQKAKDSMPKFLLDSIDVLIVDEIGKNVSGPGMDPNITGRTLSGLPGFHAPPIQKIFVRDLTRETHGNGSGIGLADVTTKKVIEQIDFVQVYINTITCTLLNAAKVPLVLNNDREALGVATKTCNRIAYEQAKIVWIKNTLQLEYMYISTPYLDALKERDDIEILGDIHEIKFDQESNLLSPYPR